MRADEGSHNRACAFVCQQPVDEHQPVPGTGPDRAPARPIGQARVPARLPARPELGDQLSQHFAGQPCPRRSATAAARARLLDRLRPCPVLHPSTVKASGWPRMRSVDLNLQGLTVRAVTVDGEAAS